VLGRRCFEVLVSFGPNFVVFCCLKVIFLLFEVIFLLTGLCQCRPVSLCSDPLWPVWPPPLLLVALLSPFAIFRPWAFFSSLPQPLSTSIRVFRVAIPNEVVNKLPQTIFAPLLRLLCSSCLALVGRCYFIRNHFQHLSSF
jgi:hypothetical protein